MTASARLLAVLAIAFMTVVLVGAAAFYLSALRPDAPPPLTPAEEDAAAHARWAEHSRRQPEPPARAATAPDDSSLSALVCREAQSAVRNRLKAPRTARFPDCTWSAQEYEIRADESRRLFYVFGYVDSENSFGAMLRTRWGVQLARNSDTGAWTVLRIEHNDR
jgi:hypothetical protein